MAKFADIRAGKAEPLRGQVTPTVKHRGVVQYMPFEADAYQKARIEKIASRRQKGLEGINHKIARKAIRRMVGV